MLQKHLSPSAHKRQQTLTMFLASSELNENGSIHEFLVCHFFTNQQFIGDFIIIKDSTEYEQLAL